MYILWSFYPNIFSHPIFGKDYSTILFNPTKMINQNALSFSIGIDTRTLAWQQKSAYTLIYYDLFSDNNKGTEGNWQQSYMGLFCRHKGTKCFWKVIYLDLQATRSWLSLIKSPDYQQKSKDKRKKKRWKIMSSLFKFCICIYSLTQYQRVDLPNIKEPKALPIQNSLVYFIAYIAGMWAFGLTDEYLLNNTKRSNRSCLQRKSCMKSQCRNKRILLGGQVEGEWAKLEPFCILRVVLKASLQDPSI